LRITAKSTLQQVAAVLAGALRGAGIRAVLTGGACATIYSAGGYQSEDLDLILQSSPTQRSLDEAMAQAGFARNGDYYEHPRTSFFVEFPRGPLAIGTDTSITPVEMPIEGVPVLLLSATDSCRDRLAAFYHWRDRQALGAAVAIATIQALDLEKIRAWSRREGASEGLEEFVRTLEAAKGASRRSGPRRPR
jgi:hypothetical protein